ncbi:MAG: hypothetical protein OEX02_05815, partial [Cyclobacteriaceae bacterium]|nr:hypothetical protein [Cyclobacteriaceae bacterium]
MKSDQLVMRMIKRGIVLISSFNRTFRYGLLVCFLALAQLVLAQEADSTKQVIHLNGDISVTNNGIS